jgi:glycosyltransferase involved in cell wall biosynthesis
VSSQPVSTIYLCGPIAEPDKPPIGGYQARNLRIAEALQRRGIEVHALRYAQPHSPGFRKWLAYAVGFSVLALRIVLCKKRSIVHITGLRQLFVIPELVLARLAKWRGCRTIYDIRDGLDLDVLWLERSAIYRYCFPRILRSVDLVMVQGESQAPFVESITGRAPVLLRNQVDLSALPARSYQNGTPSAPVIAYVGRLRPEKGISTILDTAEILTRSGFDIRVKIAGIGDEAYVDELKARYADLPVEWLGRQTNAQALDLFSEAHFFVFPTWWPGEGQSNALTEAMACGCVALVSDHGFNAATLGDCGAVLTLDQTADDYAASLRQIWEDGTWETLSRRSATRVRECFSSTAVIDHLIQQYVSLERGPGHT